MNRLVPEGMAPLAIVGTTASGKSALAMALARRHPDVELVSVDSMQVYRGMDIGTAKPTAAERAEVRHHVIDVVDPWESFEVHSFQRLVGDALADIADRGGKALLVGGTGLYLQAGIDGFEIPGRFPEVAADLEGEPDTELLHRRLVELDPVAAARMEPSNRRRIVRALEVTVGSGRPFSSFGPGVAAHAPTPVRLVGVRHAPEVVAERIAARYRQQLADGFLDEVRRLAAGPRLSRTAAQALGYRELLAHLHATEATSGANGAAATGGIAPSAGGHTTKAIAEAESVESQNVEARSVEALSVEASGAGGEVPTWARSLEAAVDEAIRRTRHFARRQRSWFRRDPRITWLDASGDPDASGDSADATGDPADPADLVDPADQIAHDHWS